MDNRNVSVFGIQVDASQAVESMKAYEAEIKNLKDRQDELKDSTKTVGMTQKEVDEEYAKNAEKIKILNQRMAAQRKAIQNQIKAQEDNGRSLVAMRAELSNLVAQFDNMSQKEREGDAGHNLAKQIAELTKEIKGAEYATERYFRNVGNYPGRLDEAFKHVSEGFETMGDSAQAFGNKCGGPLGNVANGIKGINVAMKAIYANPLIALIGVIVAILIKMASAISNNEELMNRLKVAMGPLNMVMDAFANALDWCADKLVSLIEVMSSGIAAILDFIGVTNEAGAAVEEYNRQTREEIALEKERRKQKVDASKTDLQVAQLRDKLAKTDKKNVTERKQLLQQVLDLEEKKALKDKELAEREFKLLQEKAKNAANDAQANDELAEAEAKMYKAQTDYFNKTRELNSQMTEFDAQLAKQREDNLKKQQEAERKRIEEAKKRAEEEKQLQRDLINYQIAKYEELQKKRQETSSQVIADMNTLLQETQKQLENRQRLEMAFATQSGQTEKELTELKKQQEQERLDALQGRLMMEGAKLELFYSQGKLTAEDYARQNKAIQDQLTEYQIQSIEKKVSTEQELESRKQAALSDLQAGYDAMMKTSLGKSREAAVVQKGIATAQIAVNAGKAIAEAVSSAADVPFPANLAAMAGAVAQVAALIASAYDTIGSAKFATGGLVGGQFSSRTDDSVIARLSVGESVMNSRSTALYAPLLSALNQSTGGAPINAVSAGASANDNDFLAVQFAKAVSNIQPVVSVEEINRVTNNVKVIESSASFT